MNTIIYNIIRAKNRRALVQFYFMNQKWYVEFDENTTYFDEQAFKRRLVNDWPRYRYDDFEIVRLADISTSVSEYESLKSGRYVFTQSSNLRGA